MKTFTALTVPVFLIVMLQSCDWSMARPYSSGGSLLSGIGYALQEILDGLDDSVTEQVQDTLSLLIKILMEANSATGDVGDGVGMLFNALFGYGSGEYSSGEESSSGSSSSQYSSGGTSSYGGDSGMS